MATGDGHNGEIDYLTTADDVVEYNQENRIAHSRASACQNERERKMWLGIRRALFIAIQAIEERYGMPQTKAGR